MSSQAEIVDALVAEAGATVALLTIEERVLPLTAADLAGGVVTDLAGGTEVDAPRWETCLTATNAAGEVLATRRTPGQRAMACLPRALHFARSTGRTVDLRAAGRSGRFTGTSVLGAPREPTRSEGQLVKVLRKGGWDVAVEQHVVTLMRGRAGRRLGLAILMLLLVTIFAPISLLVAAAAALGGRGQLRALAAMWAEPFRRIDERLRIEIRTGSLRWAVWRDGRVVLDRTLDPNRLLAVHASGPFDEAVALVEPTGATELPCLARGETARSFRPPQADALADLIVRVWAKPPPGYRG